MKRACSLLLCLLLLGSFMIPASALSFYATHYEENIYAGGIVDLYAYPNEGNTEDFTYQWQFDAGFGDHSSWYDVPENDSYSGGKTNHLQIRTSTGSYDGWEEIPFQCIVTAPDGSVSRTGNIYIEIYPTEKLIPNMKNWGYGLFAPNVKNAIDLYSTDQVNYTASAYAGTKLQMYIGSKSIDDKPVLRKSEVNLKTEIHITENGHTTVSANNTSYIPYTVGPLKVEFKQKLTIGAFDLGYFDTKTVNVTVSQPTTRMTAPAKSDCSLLRYTYNESQKLASIPKGATLNIVGEEGSYYQVYYGGFVGYVGKSLVGSAADAAGKLITEVDVTIPQPVAGQSPAATCAVETVSCALYHTDPVTWTDAETGKAVTGKFQEGKQYTVSIWLAAKSGYEFQLDASGNPKLGAAINGNLPPYIHKAYEQDPKQVVELSYTFAATQAAPETPETVEVTSPIVTPEPPAHTHTPSDWRSTGAYHYKACTTCGDFLTQEDHKGGKATCKEEGACAVCGYPYLETTEAHLPDTSKWTACGDLYHAHLCKLCGAHCDAREHAPGPEATETTAQTCTECGYVLVPAKNHTHQLTHMPYVAATCLATGTVEHYTCSGCSTLFSDPEGKKPLREGVSVIIPYLTHETADSWGMDADFHWRSCKLCQTVLDETKLDHRMQGETCVTCGYGAGAEADDPAEAPTETAPVTTAKPAVGRSWLTLVLVGLACFAAAITTTVIILKKKK